MTKYKKNYVRKILFAAKQWKKLLKRIEKLAEDWNELLKKIKQLSENKKNVNNLPLYDKNRTNIYRVN